MLRILIVEDEMAIARHLTKFLEKNNYSVEHLDSGLEVVERVKLNQPDLIVLDLMLPHKDGVTCCKEIREFSDVPIIMLTAKAEEIERIIGLKAGADDYVCKPFSAMELILRIKAILNRSNKASHSNTLSLDTDNFTIQYKHHSCELSQIEFLLFNLLFQKPGRIYSRGQMVELAYPDDRDILDRAIDSHIKNVRRKLKSLKIKDNVIDSVYGAGYRFLMP